MMRNESGHVAYGVLALVFGMLGGIGCSGNTDVIEPPPNQPDGGDAQVQPDGDAGGCPTLSFAQPEDGAQLNETDDADGDFCGNGFQYDVVVATGASDGTTIAVFGEGGKLGEGTVAAGIARIDGVQLTSNGTESLRAEIVGTECSATAQVSVACSGAPTCEVTEPEITATHPKLNGVPVADGGDRVSAAGSPYQVAFEVHTTVADGQPVILSVDGDAEAVSANAVGGVATFQGVTLTPDGEHTVSARCVPKTGIDGLSSEVTYTVDTAAPALTSQKVQENDEVTALQDGDHWNPEDDADPATDGLQLRICGATSDADALDLPASLGAGQQNFCVAVGTSSPVCSPATSAGGASGDGTCVNIDCPGGGPFDLTVTMKDDAGNPTTETIQGVTCASTLPQVQFLDPVGDGPTFDDIDKRILAASMAGQVQRVDKDGATPGAQYDVVVCTTATAGIAHLYASIEGQAAELVAETQVANDTAGECTPLGFDQVAHFDDVTLPESSETQVFQLLSPTALTAEVTTESNATGTGTVLLWVDSTAPSLTVANPSGLCGKIYDTDTAVTTDVQFLSSVAPVNLAVNATTYVGTSVVLGSVTIDDVIFEPGISHLSAHNEEPAGNRGTIPDPCTVTVGHVPTVTWETPVSTSLLAASTTSGSNVIADADGTAAGWQGNLRVCTDVDMSMNPGATVEFSSNGGALAPPVGLDASGCAELTGATLPDAPAQVLTATTSPINGYSGTAQITLPVDTVAPDAPTNLSATVVDRRATTISLSWTAPSDGGNPAGAYIVKYGTSPIGDSNFASASTFSYSGVPGNPGTQDNINVTNLYVEHDYYFAVAAKDNVGNTGPIAATSNPARAEFNSLELSSGVQDEKYGYSVDGSADINADGFTDLIVGSHNGTAVYVYFGSISGVESTPSLVISGASTGFGIAVAAVGDVNSDGITDFAVGSPLDGTGSVYVFYGRASWPSSLNSTQASAVISASTSTDPKYATSYLGYAIARIGDFNLDGVDDFAVGVPFYDYNSSDFTSQGRVIVVLGSTAGLPTSITVPQAVTIGDAIAIAGDPGARGSFGYSLTGLGAFYNDAGGATAVMCGSPWIAGGIAYAFSGSVGISGTVPNTARRHAYTNTGGGRIGLYMMSPLGSLPGLAGRATGFAFPNEGYGRARMLTGTTTTGPFGSLVANIQDATASASYDFGTVAMGGGVPGTSVVRSFVGDSEPDVVVSRRATGGTDPRIYIVDGTVFQTVSGTTVDIAAIASVVISIPADWQDFSSRSVAGDINDDGYGDIFVGSIRTSSTPGDGRVLVLW